MSEDKRLARLSKLCLALPEAERGYLDNHHGDGIVSVSCKMALGENREVAALDPDRFYLPAYMTHHGWVAMRLDTGAID